MTEESISKLVNRICAIFPTTPIPKNTIIEGWAADRRLRALDLDPQQKERLLDEIEKLNGWPNLPQLRAMILGITTKPQAGPPTRCEICDNTGWDNGLRLSGTMHNPVVQSPAMTTEWEGHTYTQVIPCRCERGRSIAAHRKTLSNQN
jgi:hypothetical protein